eukprot:CAMPEP_0206283042 /NCGR_PEP_ID=MMETSP0047_2-20121206/40011_1 /ASSEMBLY_ACC=CAM_ASM_000192 /TAXON_ID=195065 /ORGANISM="Chroomonas mesostigmatica_cf, Strain CCMP1168" /LENGTH=245 /DNA_ID=CAMNT_0053713365 /DNA_START=218 /DNA_END=955 /DNA_ORIENTATION=-
MAARTARPHRAQEVQSTFRELSAQPGERRPENQAGGLHCWPCDLSRPEHLLAGKFGAELALLVPYASPTRTQNKLSSPYDEPDEDTAQRHLGDPVCRLPPSPATSVRCGKDRMGASARRMPDFLDLISSLVGVVSPDQSGAPARGPAEPTVGHPLHTILCAPSVSTATDNPSRPAGASAMASWQSQRSGSLSVPRTAEDEEKSLEIRRAYMRIVGLQLHDEAERLQVSLASGAMSRANMLRGGGG